jgi:hypothetical protein
VNTFKANDGHYFKAKKKKRNLLIFINKARKNQHFVMFHSPVGSENQILIIYGHVFVGVRGL